MSNEFTVNMTLQPQPYEVVDGPQIAYGQITLGYCVGIRFEAHSGKWVDAIVFAPTPEDVERALGAFTITKTCYGSTNAPRAIMDATKLKPLTDCSTVEREPVVKWADMDEDDPRWHLNAVVDGLLGGEGAYDDHLMWREALVKAGLAHDLINRITEKVCAQEDRREPTTWSRHVASMVGCYLGWGVEDKRIETVAGIIERRRWCEPKPAKPSDEGRCVHCGASPDDGELIEHASNCMAAKPAEPFLNLREAERVSDLPAVDEAIRALLADNTGDNAVALVQTILESVRDQNLKPHTQGDENGD